MSKRAEEMAFKAYPSDIYSGGKSCRRAYKDGYEQAEKDIWAAIGKYLSKRDTRDYSTVGWILKHLDEYKKAIMEEE